MVTCPRLALGALDDDDDDAAGEDEPAAVVLVEGVLTLVLDSLTLDEVGDVVVVVGVVVGVVLVFSVVEVLGVKVGVVEVFFVEVLGVGEGLGSGSGSGSSSSTAGRGPVYAPPVVGSRYQFAAGSPKQSPIVTS